MVYAVILWSFAYYDWMCVKPLGLIILIIFYAVYTLLYSVINHVFIKKLVGFKIIIIFETLLLSSLITLMICYLDIENHSY